MILKLREVPNRLKYLFTHAEYAQTMAYECCNITIHCDAVNVLCKDGISTTIEYRIDGTTYYVPLLRSDYHKISIL